MSNPNKQRGSAFEGKAVKIARDAGLTANKQPGSGVYADYPSDVVIENLLVECKKGYTLEKSDGSRYFQFDLNWLTKVRQFARRGKFLDGLVFFSPAGSQLSFTVLAVETLIDLLKRQRIQAARIRDLDAEVDELRMQLGQTRAVLDSTQRHYNILAKMLADLDNDHS